jgi:UDP-2,4-diacetamido-2,4,6-trideoxy-beta-L-altropyranose hydrolase
MTALRAGIWADGGAGVGFGHLSRCCAVAQALARLGADTAIFTVDPQSTAYVTVQGVPAQSETSFAEFAFACARTEIALIDSYRLSQTDWAALDAVSPVIAAFDDWHTNDLPVDVVINSLPGADQGRYRVRPGTRYLLGPQYVALRAIITQLQPHSVRGDVRRILISLGGGGSRGLVYEVAAVAAQCYPLAAITATVGPFDEMDSFAVPSLELLRMPDDFAQRMRDADILICGGGQTLCEAAALGTPAVGLCLGAEQRENLASMAQLGGCLAVFPERPDRPIDPKTLGPVLLELRHRGSRQRCSAASRQIVDGRGRDRIAAVLTAMAEQKRIACPK